MAIIQLVLATRSQLT